MTNIYDTFSDIKRIEFVRHLSAMANMSVSISHLYCIELPKKYKTIRLGHTFRHSKMEMEIFLL